MRPPTGLAATHDFWNIEPCGTHFVPEFADRRDFYAKYREFRYRTEWHIPELVQFERARGKSVLEIGCGNGADGVMFAQNGARYTGVDLTEAAVNATREHFQTLALPGTFQQENAQQLSFPDASFDIVYSWGVLHHTPDPGAAFAQVHRVLKPGGRAIIMLYHRHSFNYYVRIMFAMRLRLALTILARRGKPIPEATADEIQDRRRIGNQDRDLYDAHYRAYLREGWSYLRADRFVHHCTDGPECPYAYVYTASDVRRLFSAFSKVSTRVAHFPLRKYRRTAWVPLSIERALARTMGWNLVVYAER